MNGPTDPRLLLLAKEAKVRPPHVFFVWHMIAADPAAFSAAACAEFAQLELPHVERIVAALKAGGLYPERRRRSLTEREKATRLPATFQVPQAWKLWAQTERGWTPEVVETVAAEFVDYWISAPKGTKLDWHATWRNSVRGSRRPSGQYVGHDSTPLSAEAEAERLAANEEFRVRIGRE